MGAACVFSPEKVDGGLSHRGQALKSYPGVPGFKAAGRMEGERCRVNASSPMFLLLRWSGHSGKRPLKL